jgi:hypothetical protein
LSSDLPGRGSGLKVQGGGSERIAPRAGLQTRLTPAYTPLLDCRPGTPAIIPHAMPFERRMSKPPVAVSADRTADRKSVASPSGLWLGKLRMGELFNKNINIQ